VIVLIDADLVAYRCAASVSVDAPVDIAIARCDRLMQEIIHATSAEKYMGFLTGSNNFRKIINPLYKANRTQPPPKWLQECREFLVLDWHCKISDGCEADDLLGITQTSESIVASLDKDLQMIPGKHYNWVKAEDCIVTPQGGLKHFYKQMLIGDRTDNIFGVDGIGKVKAERIIEPLQTEKEMIEQVYSLYNEDAHRFLMNAQCLWIMQNEGETWGHRVNHSILPDPLLHALEAMLGSMTFSMDDISMEPITTPTTMCGIPVNGDQTESMEIETVPLIWSIPDELD